jgi:MFS transporter, DHA1 family, tetracycline resistance protein
MVKKRPLLPIFFTVFMDLIGIGIIIPILAVLFIRPEAGLLPLDYTLSQRTLLLGLLIASYPAAQFFGAPILGALSDRYGRKRMLLISLFGTLIGYIIFGIGIKLHSIPLLFASRILDGFTGGNIAIAMSAIADLSDAKSKVRNFGMMGVAFGLGFILGPFLGGKFADPSLISWFDYATPLWIAAGLSLVNIVLVIFFFVETLRKKRKVQVSPITGFRNIYKAFHKPHLRTMFTVSFLYVLGFMFFTQFFQVYLIDKFHVDQTEIGDMFAFMGVCIVLTQGLVTRNISKHFAPQQVLKYTILGLALTLPILLIPNAWIGLFFIIPFVSLFQGLTMPNTTATISNLAHADEQGEILGLNQSIQSAAMTLPPVISGIVYALHRTLPILISAVCIFAAWLVYIFFYRKHIAENI